MKNTYKKTDNSHPHNVLHTFFTFAIIIILVPLAYLDSIRWNDIMRDASEWNRIKQSRSISVINTYIVFGSQNNRFINKAVAYLDELKRKEINRTISLTKKQMSSRIKNLKLLKLGERNDVVRIQQLLAMHGYYHGKLNGVANILTKNAIHKYKFDHGLKPVSSSWDRNTQISANLLSKYKGYEVSRQLISKRYATIMEQYKNVVQLHNDPLKYLKQLKKRIMKNDGLPAILVLDVFINDNIKQSSLIVFRVSGKLVARDISGYKVNISNHLIDKIRDVERKFTTNGKLEKLQCVVIFSASDFRTKKDLFKIINKLFYYFNKKNKRIHGQGTITVISKNHPAKLFMNQYTGFDQKNYFTSLIYPKNTTTTLYTPVISKHNGWVKLSSIKIKKNIAYKKDARIIFSVDIEDNKSRPIATYSNLVYLKAGAIKKGQFFALKIYKKQ